MMIRANNFAPVNTTWILVDNLTLRLLTNIRVTEIEVKVMDVHWDC